MTGHPKFIAGLWRVTSSGLEGSNPLENSATAFDLSEKVVVITGGGRGIGQAIARGVAARGAIIVVAGRSKETLLQATDEIVREGGRADHVVVDVTQEIDVERLRDEVLARHGRIDGLVNNAGINPYFKKPEHTPLSEWREIIDVNLTGAFLCCRAVGSSMIGHGSGSIVNVSSIAGHVGLERSAAYCAAKGGMEMMTRSLAIDWATHGIRVNTLAPGYTETELTQGLRRNEGLSAHLLQKIPQGRFARPDEMAGAAIFLLSSASSYITGQTILVDGGWTSA